MKTHRVIAVALLAATLLASPHPPARAQMDSREAIDLQNQIAELRQELQMMQTAQQTGPASQQAYPAPPTPYAGQGAPAAGGNDTVADLLVRVSALEEQVRDLQGKVDDLNNQLQRQHDDLTKQIGDLAFKMGQGGTPAGAAGGGTLGEPPAEGAPPAEPPAKPSSAPPGRRTSEMLLKQGNLALAHRDFAGAAAAAREVLGNSHGTRLTDAQFLLARAEGGLGQYKQSAADFYKAYERAPKSATGEVALLGVANALLGMNDSRDACQALAKLSAEYPHAGAGVKAGVASARKRASCGH